MTRPRFAFKIFLFNLAEQPEELNTPAWALTALEAVSQRGVTVLALSHPSDLDPPFDFCVNLGAADTTRTYSVMARSRVQSSSLMALHNALGHHPLLLTPQITPGTADTCRSLNLDFADSSGNMLLNWGTLLIDVQGRRASKAMAVRQARPQPSLKSFTARGLAVLFTLLSTADRPIQPFRQVSEVSGASLGTVQAAIKELTEFGYLEKTGRTRRLLNTRELFGRWVDAYIINLEPRLELGRYQIEDVRRRLQKPLEGAGIVWGGEAAAALLDPHLLPSTLVIYSPTRPTPVLSRWRAGRADTRAGNLVVRHRFWTGLRSELPLAPSPLVYADLLASGDPRQVEAATRLRANDELLRYLDQH